MIAGEVKMHFELRPEGQSVVSGGRYYLDTDSNTLYLYGESMEYGAFTALQIKHTELPKEWIGRDLVIRTDIKTEFELMFEYDL